jgi:hypothetical protein
MPDHDLPVITLPDDLSDEAAASMLEFLYELARLLEHHYAGQLLRHYHRPDPRQAELWQDQDPPF